MENTEVLPPRVLLVGAGFVGARVVELLEARGCTVRATTRRPPNAFDIVNDSVSKLADMVAGVDAAVFCYSATQADGDKRSAQKIDRHAFYVGAARKLVQACRTAKLRRVVYTSSTSALPERDALLDESCDLWPTSERGRVQREAEEIVAAGLGAADQPWTILRLAGIYGPGRPLGRIYQARSPKPLPGDGMRPTNLIHRDDAASAVLCALALEPKQRGLINICADDHRTRRELFAEIARRSGEPAPRWSEEPAPDAPPTGKRVDNTKMKQRLGLKLAFPSHALD